MLHTSAVWLLRISKFFAYSCLSLTTPLWGRYSNIPNWQNQDFCVCGTITRKCSLTNKSSLWACSLEENSVHAPAVLQGARRLHWHSPSGPVWRRLKQSARQIAALPPQAGCLGVFIQVAGLAEPLATLQAGVRLFSCVHTDVFLAVCQGQKRLAADLACILACTFYNQDIVLR